MTYNLLARIAADFFNTSQNAMQAMLQAWSQNSAAYGEPQPGHDRPQPAPIIQESLEAPHPDEKLLNCNQISATTSLRGTSMYTRSPAHH